MERKSLVPILFVLVSLTVSGVIAYSYVTYSFSAGLCIWTATDVNDDGTVDVHDLFDLGKAYNSVPGDANWNPDCDFNRDNIVDFSDLDNLSRNYGETKPC